VLGNGPCLLASLLRAAFTSGKGRFPSSHGELLPVIACVCLSILSDRTKDVLSDMPSFEKLVCHSSVPPFWSDRRAAHSKGHHVQTSKRQLVNSSQRPKTTNITTMVNSNPVFPALSPEKRAAWTGGIVADKQSIDQPKCICSYPSDRCICPWCGTSSIAHTGMSKHWDIRCQQYRHDNPKAKASAFEFQEHQEIMKNNSKNKGMTVSKIYQTFRCSPLSLTPSFYFHP
jgi:hypothetical protein